MRLSTKGTRSERGSSWRFWRPRWSALPRCWRDTSNSHEYRSHSRTVPAHAATFGGGDVSRVVSHRRSLRRHSHLLQHDVFLDGAGTPEHRTEDRSLGVRHSGHVSILRPVRFAFL